MNRRYGTPDWADTQTEADAWADAVDRHHDDQADIRDEAALANFRMDANTDGPLTQALAKLMGDPS